MPAGCRRTRPAAARAAAPSTARPPRRAAARSATHVKVASLPLTARHSSSRSPKRIGSPVALNVPPTPVGRRPHDPAREIADVDELHGVVGRARREHLAASRDAVRPVREAARRVVRPDDEARAHDEGGVAEGLLDDPLARRLARAVRLRVLVGLLLRRQLLDGSALHRRHALVRVDGDAGDEDVAADVAAQRVARAPDLVRACTRRRRAPRPTRAPRAPRGRRSGRRAASPRPGRAPDASARG